ncbi:MAG: adenosylcobinamide-GDP ribazoletransferase [Bacillota bacterium]|nr:adenosylcobinamide-GDP ribazoletransferase [Bacillota bacterium]
MIDGIILSFQVFSRIPLKKPVDFSPKNLKIALGFLPSLGLLIGGLVGLVLDVLSDKSRLLGSALGLFLYIILTGGLHLDGLADTVDGFYSNASPERILEIMKDSLIGSFGTLALILYCILKVALYGSFSNDLIFTIGQLSFVSRMSSLYVIKRGGLARPGGFGSVMKEALSDYKALAFNGLILLALAFYNWRILPTALVTLIVGEFIVRLATKKIKGLSGDIYGATIEINELVGLLVYWGLLWI